MQESTAKEFFLWMIRRRLRYRVTGASMQPLLADGDEVLVDQRAYRHQVPRIGDLVVAHHPTQAGLQIIKRVHKVQGADLYHLQGDNPDPAQNSPSQVPAEMILGCVTSRFASAP